MAADVSIKLGFAIEEFQKGMATTMSTLGNLQKECTLAGKSASASLEPLSKLGKNLAISFGAPLAALTALGMDSAKTIETESKKILSAVAGNAAVASFVIDNADKLAKKSTFGKDELLAASRALLTFGVAAADIPQTLETLAKVAKGSKNSLEDVTKIYEKMASDGEVSSRTLKQFTSAQIPMIQALANHFKITGDKSAQVIKEMAANGQIGMKDIDAAMLEMTTNSGIYSMTFNGSMNTLGSAMAMSKKSITDVAASFVTALEPSIIRVQKVIVYLCEIWQNLSADTKGVIATVILVSATIGTLLLIIPKVVMVINMMKVSMLAFNVVCMANPYIAVAAALAILVVGTYAYSKSCETAEEAQLRLNRAKADADKGVYAVSDNSTNSLDVRMEKINKLTSTSEKLLAVNKELLKVDKLAADMGIAKDSEIQLQQKSYWNKQRLVLEDKKKNEHSSGGNDTEKNQREKEAAVNKWVEFVDKANHDEMKMNQDKYDKESEELDHALAKGLIDKALYAQAELALDKKLKADDIATTRKTSDEKAKAFKSAFAMNDDVMSKFDSIQKASQDGVLTGWQVTASKIGAAFTSAMSAVSNLMKAIFASESQAIEQKYQKQTEAEKAYSDYQEQQDAAAYKKMTSKEKKEHDLKTNSDKARKEADKKMAHEKSVIQREEAEIGKAMSITEIGIQTAIGIMKAFGEAGPFAGVPLAAMIGTLGAIQTAAVIATPLPPLLAQGGVATGRTNAIIGEAGAEMVFPLTSSNGQNAIALLADKLLLAIQSKVSNTSNNILPYQSSVQRNRADSLNNNNDGGTMQPVELVLNGSILGTALFKLSKSGDLLISNKSVVSEG